jgi:hypothetical protein
MATLTVLFLAVLVFRGENSQADLQWLCLAMAAPCRFLVEGIVWKLDLLQGENLHSNHVG